MVTVCTRPLIPSDLFRCSRGNYLPIIDSTFEIKIDDMILLLLLMDNVSLLTKILLRPDVLSRI